MGFLLPLPPEGKITVFLLPPEETRNLSREPATHTSLGIYDGQISNSPANVVLRTVLAKWVDLSLFNPGGSWSAQSPGAGVRLVMEEDHFSPNRWTRPERFIWVPEGKRDACLVQESRGKSRFWRHFLRFWDVLRAFPWWDMTAGDQCSLHCAPWEEREPPTHCPVGGQINILLSPGEESMKTREPTPRLGFGGFSSVLLWWWEEDVFSLLPAGGERQDFSLSISSPEGCVPSLSLALHQAGTREAQISPISPFASPTSQSLPLPREGNRWNLLPTTLLDVFPLSQVH